MKLTDIKQKEFVFGFTTDVIKSELETVFDTTLFMEGSVKDLGMALGAIMEDHPDFRHVVELGLTTCHRRLRDKLGVSAKDKNKLTEDDLKALDEEDSDDADRRYHR
jgi:hypothetical protein